MSGESVDLAKLPAAYQKVRDELLAERTPGGHWVGELSSSALATATAVSALAVVRRGVGWDTAAAAAGPPTSEQGTGDRGQLGKRPPTTHHSPLINHQLGDLIPRGVAYLATQQNADGGFGDTDLSHSNIATTYLVVAALHLAGVASEHVDLLVRADAYLALKGRLPGLRERYGIDKTFVVPIMTNLALAGLVEWREIDPLPFEMACVPQSLYRFVGMPVVSYAIPALVAIGQAQFHHAPPRNPLTRLIRWLSITRSLKVLRRMQPDSGGYLEATPLTSFVVMSLASFAVQGPRSKVQGQKSEIGDRRSEVGGPAAEVISEGVKFLVNSVRPDGSWPIDTNLATWNTTLAINALAGAGEDVAELLGQRCLDWLLSCQHTKRHPFTGADPGGFGWSDLSGAVPDADDTPGALLALGAWYRSSRASIERDRIAKSSATALRWLLSLQNSDRGWPTFCRGWGKLPFDRSGSDLTAHAIRAIADWQKIAYEPGDDAVAICMELRGVYREALDRARVLGADYMVTRRNPNGSWSPLWFGNQDHHTEDNPTYGTAKALFAFRDLGKPQAAEASQAFAWLVANQNADGGWGSGVWEKVRSTERGVRSENRAQLESLGEPVLSTKYSVRSTTYDPVGAVDAPATVPSLQPSAPNLKSSVEETALAVEALLGAVALNPGYPQGARTLNACLRGLAWLLDRVERGEHRQPAPIGFYFAKLWYYERLYPLTFTVAALGRACRQFAPATPADSTTSPPDTRRA